MELGKQFVKRFAINDWPHLTLLRLGYTNDLRQNDEIYVSFLLLQSAVALL